jgi:threonine dehydrogenase-like Zn-dependent dehydrogenase
MSQTNRQITFVAEREAEVRHAPPPADPPAANAVRLRTRYTLVSPGTELACYRGTESWAPFPHVPGYAASGRVTAIGSNVEGVAEGDLVFCYNPHSDISDVDLDVWFVTPLAESDLRLAPFVRLAAVSITALQTAPPQLGDRVVVQGLGPVGNFAAQLFTLSGAEVVGVDVSPTRLELARQCGIKHVVNAAESDPVEAVKDLLGGKGAATVVEATGLPDLCLTATKMVAPGGGVVLLGSPRGSFRGDATELLRRVHLWDFGCVRLDGAHEWRIPIKPQPFVRHSISRNCELLLNLIRDNRLKVEPLLTRTATPEEAQDVYRRLLEEPDEHLVTLFDWSAG